MSDFKSIGGTVRARAASELRDRILTGRLRPGDRLDLDEITQQFGTSRTPVREALLELSYEGLVAVTPRSGITVVGITPEDAVDNFAVLAALAGKAAEWATARITEEQLAELHALADAIGDGGDVVAANRRLPPGRQPRVRLAPPADLPPPGGAGRAGQLLRAVPRAGAPQPQGARRAARRHQPGRRGRGPAVAEAHVLDAGAALGDWLRTQAADADVVDAQETPA